MDELHEQTVNLLSFQDLPKNVFDVQVAFNMVARLWSSLRSLAGSRHEANSEALSTHRGRRSGSCATGFASPCVSWARLLSLPRNGKAGFGRRSFQALAGEHVIVSSSYDESPTNVSAAGQGDILVSHDSDAMTKMECGSGLLPIICGCRFDGGGMCRKYDRLPPARPDSMSGSGESSVGKLSIGLPQE